jgi:hypothetical protein
MDDAPARAKHRVADRERAILPPTAGQPYISDFRKALY